MITCEVQADKHPLVGDIVCFMGYFRASDYRIDFVKDLGQGSYYVELGAPIIGDTNKYTIHEPTQEVPKRENTILDKMKSTLMTKLW